MIQLHNYILEKLRLNSDFHLHEDPDYIYLVWLKSKQLTGKTCQIMYGLYDTEEEAKEIKEKLNLIPYIYKCPRKIKEQLIDKYEPNKLHQLTIDENNKFVDWLRNNNCYTIH